LIFGLNFFGLLIVTAVVYWCIPKQIIRNIVLIVSSFIFIGLNDINALIVVVSLSIYTYLFGYFIEIKTNKKLFLKIGIIGLLIILVIFKYLGLLTNTVNQISYFITGFPKISVIQLFLPLGLSYIVFKYISYLTDIYWRIYNKGNFINFLLYGSLFTIFSAGPIERFEKLNPQLENKINFKSEYIEISFERIIYGLAKKFIIADWIGYFVSPVWNNSNDYNLYIKAIALLGFSVQIYMDFSGYSDIAIGASKLFGFTIMENFNFPYFKPNISQFWRSWHISLSDWIKDYIFFPLSRFSNKKVWLMFFVPLISMGICGIWHGAGWNFLIWGFWHGFGLFIYQIWLSHSKRHKKTKSKYPGISYSIGVLITFIYVTIGWAWFI
jgi:alginate O-acetyltransferase complex protein AlgI